MPMAAAAARRRANPVQALAAVAMLVVVWAGLRTLGLRGCGQAARWIARRTRRTATVPQVRQALDALDMAAVCLPVRVACLERSLAGVLLLALRGRCVTWRLGVRTPPLAMHAWLSDDHGHPIGEPVEALSYQPVLTIGPGNPAARSST